LAELLPYQAWDGQAGWHHQYLEIALEAIAIKVRIAAASLRLRS
jgi:hypothetical protein